MLEDLEPPVKALPCGVRKLQDHLDEADKTVLQKALDNENAWPAKTLSRALGDKGLALGDGPIRKHRTGRCSCR